MRYLRLFESKLSNSDIELIKDIILDLDDVYPLTIDEFESGTIEELKFLTKDGIHVKFDENAIIFRMNSSILSQSDLNKEFEPIKTYIVNYILKRIQNMGFYVSYKTSSSYSYRNVCTIGISAYVY